MSNIREKSNKASNLEKHYSFVIGIYLSVLAFALIILLIFIKISAAIQQFIVVAVGILMLISFLAFKQLIEPNAKQFDCDRTVITYHNYYENNNASQKQNLVTVTAEIQQLLAQLSQVYTTSIPNEANVEADKLEIIKDLETLTHQELTTQERVMVAEAIQKIENDANLKFCITNTLHVAGIGTFKEFICYPLISFVLAAFEEWQKTKTNVE